MSNFSVSLITIFGRLKNWWKSIFVVKKGGVFITFKKCNWDVMKILLYFFTLFHEHLLMYILNICNFSMRLPQYEKFLNHALLNNFQNKKHNWLRKNFVNSFWSLFLWTSPVVNIKTKIKPRPPQNHLWLMCLIVLKKESSDYSIKHLLESQLMLFSASSIHALWRFILWRNL